MHHRVTVFEPTNTHAFCAALALIFGPESMIVCRDVLRIDEKMARKVKSWAVRALVRVALAAQEDGEKKRKRTRQTRG
ncbi:MAG TPA: hypothetical protein VIT91_18780 [Chthoniobacterales bacterium]